MAETNEKQKQKTLEKIVKSLNGYTQGEANEILHHAQEALKYRSIVSIADVPKYYTHA